ncbi:MAG TPA: hypothetical protein VMF13_11625 [Luteitalea sp.]|nr:hypothetical protein [Luteitalea sp.]
MPIRSVPFVLTLVLATAAGARPALSQVMARPLLSMGVGAAVNCAGSNDGIPVLPCTRWGEPTPGVHPRLFVDARPRERVLLSLSAGTLRLAQRSYDVTTATPHETWRVTRAARTSWHLTATAAYVGGAPTHRVRGFIGGGAIGFWDRVSLVASHESGGAQLARTPSDGSTGAGAAFTTGFLVTGPGRWIGKVSYLLASHMADADRSDGGWRHEVTFGVAWRLRASR